MRLQQLLQEQDTQLFTATFRYGRRGRIVYNFIVKFLGKDGRNRPIFVGKMKVFDPENPDEKMEMLDVAVVIRTNNAVQAGEPLAIFFATNPSDAKEAAQMAIDTEQKAYGKGHRDPLENWDTYDQKEFEVDGYDYEG